jgi:hypothetical protein
LARLAAAAGGIAVIASLAAPPAVAGPVTRARALAGTWTVTPGGSFSFSGSGRFKDAVTGHFTQCAVITLSGTLKSGSGLPGRGIGSVTSASFGGCGLAGVGVAVTPGAGRLPWELNALSYNSATGVTTGSIEDIDLVVAESQCHMILDGTAAGANDGLTKIGYTNSTGKIALRGPGGNLHSRAVSGCFGLISSGDGQTASGSGTVTPKQAITSP